MRTGWRSTVENMYRDLVRDQIGAKWQANNVPPDYSRPRLEMDSLIAAVHWLHPSPPPVGGPQFSGPSFYVPRNLRLIRDCDIVLSCIYPGYESIDSAHEIGVAYAWSKPVVTIDLTHGAGDYAAWRAMSLVVVDSMELAADFLLYQVQGSVNAEILAENFAHAAKLVATVQQLEATTS